MLQTTISCTVRFVTLCFTIELHVQALPWQLTWKIYSKLSKARMKVWAIKARWIKTCLVSDKRYGITITKLAYCFMLAIRLWLWNSLLHNVAENINKKLQKQERKVIKNEKRCRNGVPKSTQTRKDKHDGKYTKPLPCIFILVKRCCDGWGFVYLPSLLSFLVCVLFGMPFLHLFKFFFLV